MKKKPATIIPAIALRSITSKTGKGIYASSDVLFKGAIFGRDSLEVAEDLLRIKPRLTRNIILTLAALQGQVTNDANEEEPGRIVHEYRSVTIDGKPIDEQSMAIFKEVSSKWGGNEREMAYYGSVDATPLFLRVLNEYVSLHGDKILSTVIQQRDGTAITLRECAVHAINWLLNRLDSSRSGLLEFQRRNPLGIPNQVWKDSETFFVHENGEQANHNAPVASIELQGLAYDGLIASARFMPSRAEEFRLRANRLRDSTIELLWMEEQHRFALGLDYDQAGQMRIMKTATANPAALLDSFFFDDLPSDEQQKYVSVIIENIMSSDFLTDAGIRSRALSASNLINFWDYHGSFVSWPKETYDIAKGMQRQGFPLLARQLENRILNIALKNRKYPEFVYVDEKGRVMTASPPKHPNPDEIIVIESTNQPEGVQAWTVSAGLAIASTRVASKFKPRRKLTIVQEPWQVRLEKKILASIHKTELYVNPFALSARYPTYHYQFSPIKENYGQLKSP